MRKQHNQELTPIVIHRVWSYSDALKAIPYVRALLRSLREHWLDMQGARLQMRRLDDRPGRPDRQVLIQREDLSREAARAQEQFEDTSDELLVLDVHHADPANGLALIPFDCGDDLAWFVIDLFALQGLVAWRREADAPETRRPLESLPAAVIRQ